MFRTIVVLCSVLALVSCQRELPPIEAAHKPAAEGDAGAAVSRTRAVVLSPQRADSQDISAKVVPATLCSLDGLGDASFAAGTVRLPNAGPALLHGWLGIDGEQPVSPSEVLIVFDPVDSVVAGAGPWVVRAAVNGRREDVAAARNAPGLEDSGLEVAVDFASMPKGLYRVSMRFGDETTYLCDGGWSIELAQ